MIVSKGQCLLCLSSHRSFIVILVGFHFLLQGIFPTPGSNPGLLHCRQTLYHKNMFTKWIAKFLETVHKTFLNLSSRPVVLKVWFLNQQLRHILQFIGNVHERALSQHSASEVPGWSLLNCDLTRYSADLKASYSLGPTDPDNWASLVAQIAKNLPVT